MPYAASVYIKNNQIYSCNPEEYTVKDNEIINPIIAMSTKDGHLTALVLTDDFFSEEKRRYNPIQGAIDSGQIDNVHSITVFGHSSKSVSNMVQLIALGMSYAMLSTPFPEQAE